MNFFNNLFGGASGKALNAMESSVNKPAGQNSASPPWMQYGNMMAGNVRKGAYNMSHPQKEPTNAPQTPQQGLDPLKQQMPGKIGYTPTTSPYGQDMSNPGVQEQFWNQNQKLWTNGAFQGPGQGEQ